jgi:hypothetical protein
MPWRLVAVAIGIWLWSVGAQAQHDGGRVQVVVPLAGEPLQVDKHPKFFAWRIDTATGDVQVCGHGPNPTGVTVCTALVPPEGGVAPPEPNAKNIAASPEETSSLRRKRAFGEESFVPVSKGSIAYELVRDSPALPVTNGARGQGVSIYDSAWKPVGLPILGLELADLLAASLSGSGVPSVNNSVFISATSGIPISEDVPTPAIWGSVSGLALQLARLPGVASQLARLNGSTSVGTLIPASTVLAGVPSLSGVLSAQNGSPAIAVNSVFVEVSRVTLTATSPNTTPLAVGGILPLNVQPPGVSTASKLGASATAGVSPVSVSTAAKVGGSGAATAASVSAAATAAVSPASVSTAAKVVGSAVATATSVSAAATAAVSPASVSTAAKVGVSVAVTGGVSPAAPVTTAAKVGGSVAATAEVSPAAVSAAAKVGAPNVGAPAAATRGASAAITAGVRK